jgi:hypothetical protein
MAGTSVKLIWLSRLDLRSSETSVNFYWMTQIFHKILPFSFLLLSFLTTYSVRRKKKDENFACLYKLCTDYRDFSTTRMSGSILFLELLHSHLCIILILHVVHERITPDEKTYTYIWFPLYFRFSRNIHSAFKECRDSFTRTKKYDKLLTDNFRTGVRHATASLYAGTVSWKPQQWFVFKMAFYVSCVPELDGCSS